MSKNLKLIYVASATLAAAYIEKGHKQRNPDYFDGVEKGATAVVVVGDFPNIVSAYEAVDGCDVKKVAEPKSAAKAKPAPKPKAPTKAEKEAQEAEAKRIAGERDALRKEIEAEDADALSARIVGLETEKDGEPHTITIEDLAGLELVALRAMVLDTIFIAD